MECKSINIYVLSQTPETDFIYTCVKKLSSQKNRSILVCDSKDSMETFDIQLWIKSQSDFITHSKFYEDIKYISRSSCVLGDVESFQDVSNVGNDFKCVVYQKIISFDPSSGNDVFSQIKNSPFVKKNALQIFYTKYETWQHNSALILKNIIDLFKTDPKIFFEKKHGGWSSEEIK